ncbi:peptidoglycan recognition family protein [Kribbella sindirgiensis]|uniref:N-acetylmuramoyl-L-alanine amidase n=1 Tax=Kribbella sindirgiensis TaxID=1124744 RepID=A0A4R0IQS6_9ACTN|nr:peptidoglycan recognition family protein [Kribbella sindirgiensis]TCC33648.1 N-acetylmuramoyl-L-alanine amidase [Kribbella sindirgiensis]
MTAPENFQHARVSRRTILGATAGGVLLGGLTVPTAAHAAPAPRCYTRTEWSARPPKSATQVIGKPDHIVIHHTASPNVTDYSLAAAYKVQHWIQDLHMDTNGWIDIGNQLTISRGGFLMEGRSKSLSAINNGQNVLGAQTANHNSHTIGIEHEGIYVSQDVTVALFDMSVLTCAWLCTKYGLDPHAAIVGHRDYNTTQCPGDVFYARLPELRDRVAAVLFG